MRPMRRPSREEAEDLAVKAVAFLAEDPEELGRFLALAGVSAVDLRKAAAEPGFLVAALDHILYDDRLVQSFATVAGVRPEAVAPAREVLEPREEF